MISAQKNNGRHHCDDCEGDSDLELEHSRRYNRTAMIGFPFLSDSDTSDDERIKRVRKYWRRQRCYLDEGSSEDEELYRRFKTKWRAEKRERRASVVRCSEYVVGYS